MDIVTARTKAREVLYRTAAELEQLKGELALDFRRLRERGQSNEAAETTNDQVRALDNVIGSVKAALLVL